MSIHSLLEQSRRNLAWRTCPTAATPATITTMTHAAETPASTGQLLQAA